MKDQDVKELRKHKRFPFIEDILIDGIQRCTSMDICECGLFVSAIQHFEEKNIINVTIPFKGEKITLKGQVQFYQSGIGMGIRFVDLNDEQRAIIMELIEAIVQKKGFE